MFARHLLVFVLIQISSSWLSPIDVSAQQVVWETDVDAALKSAQQDEKLVLLHFATDWCRPCKNLDTFTFSNPRVARAMHANLIPVKVNADVNETLVKKYSVTSVPYDVVLTASGRVVTRRKSPRDAESYIGMTQRLSKILDQVGTGDDPALQQGLDEIESLLSVEQAGFQSDRYRLMPEKPSHMMARPSSDSSHLKRMHDDAVARKKAASANRPEPPKVVSNPFFANQSNAANSPPLANPQRDSITPPKGIVNNIHSSQVDLNASQPKTKTNPFVGQMNSPSTNATAPATPIDVPTSQATSTNNFQSNNSFQSNNKIQAGNGFQSANELKSAGQQNLATNAAKSDVSKSGANDFQLELPAIEAPKTTIKNESLSNSFSPLSKNEKFQPESKQPSFLPPPPPKFSSLGDLKRASVAKPQGKPVRHSLAPFAQPTPKQAKPLDNSNNETAVPKAGAIDSVRNVPGGSISNDFAPTNTESISSKQNDDIRAVELNPGSTVFQPKVSTPLKVPVWTKDEKPKQELSKEEQLKESNVLVAVENDQPNQASLATEDNVAPEQPEFQFDVDVVMGTQRPKKMVEIESMVWSATEQVTPVQQEATAKDLPHESIAMGQLAPSRSRSVPTRPADILAQFRMVQPPAQPSVQSELRESVNGQFNPVTTAVGTLQASPAESRPPVQREPESSSPVGSRSIPVDVQKSKALLALEHDQRSRQVNQQPERSEFDAMAKRDQLEIQASTPNAKPIGVLHVQPTSTDVGKASASQTSFEQTQTNVTDGVRSAEKSKYALKGMCPVALMTKGEWVDGDREIGCVHRNRVYLFTNIAARDQFLSDPDRYSPLLAGFDPVIYLETGKLVEGLESNGVFMGKQPNQRIVLFVSPDTRRQFQETPAKFVNHVRAAMERTTPEK